MKQFLIFFSLILVSLQDQRVHSLIQYALKVEKAMFEMASGQEEYYQLLAEKIFRIRKELEERRKRRLEMAQAKPVGEGEFDYCQLESSSAVVSHESN